MQVMYKRKTPEDLECGITVAMKVFGAKWKPCIIDAIHRGIHRPSSLHREIPSATPRVIDMQLRELEESGVLFRIAHPGALLKVEYYLTELGQSILPIIESLDKWGYNNRHILQQKENAGAERLKEKFPPGADHQHPAARQEYIMTCRK